MRFPSSVPPLTCLFLSACRKLSANALFHHQAQRHLEAVLAAASSSVKESAKKIPQTPAAIHATVKTGNNKKPAAKKRKLSLNPNNLSATTTTPARPAGPPPVRSSAFTTGERSSATTVQKSNVMSTSTNPKGIGLAARTAAIEQGSPPPNTEDRMEDDGEKGVRDTTDMDKRGAVAAVPSEEDRRRVGPAAAAALAATAIPPISNGSLRAGAERSGGTGSGGGGAAAPAAAGGATGEKAVHSSPVEETAVSNKRGGVAPATAVGWEVAVAAPSRRPSPPSSVAGKVKRNYSGENNAGVQGEGWECRSKPTVAATAAADPNSERKEKQPLVAAAEAWCGAEASSLKRDAQQAKKRSWDEFENDGGSRKGVLKAGVRSTTSVVSCRSKSGNVLPKTESVPKAGNGWQPRDKSQPPAAISSGSTTPPVASVCRPSGAPEIVPVTDDDKQEAVADTPEVAAARAALAEAEALVGVDLPSLDKGPPDAEADCILCHVPRGAFLRAERGTKGFGWCHCLCAFSKGLLIENRVVKVGDANQEALRRNCCGVIPKKLTL